MVVTVGLSICGEQEAFFVPERVTPDFREGLNPPQINYIIPSWMPIK